MGTIICQTCNGTIESFEDEKVSVLYSKCDECHPGSDQNK
ncbi:GapA-binding peptide SR1P [Peribacillus alkalitolerans]|nr:GapA-binding peptide SR1P [Peribacillus alkalitolerans]